MARVLVMRTIDPPKKVICGRCNNYSRTSTVFLILFLVRLVCVATTTDAMLVVVTKVGYHFVLSEPVSQKSWANRPATRVKAVAVIYQIDPMELLKRLSAARMERGWAISGMVLGHARMALW